MSPKITTKLVPAPGFTPLGARGAPALVQPATAARGESRSAPLPSAVMGRGPGVASAQPQPPPALAVNPDPRGIQALRSKYGRQAVTLALQTLRSKRESTSAKFGKLGLSLSYTPNVTDIYTLAYAGAMAGMIGGRSIASANAPDYVTQAYAAGVWAETFDTLWDIEIAPGGISEIEAVLIFLESYAVWDGRAPATLTLAECSPTVGAVIASITEVLGYFEVVGIPNTPWNTGQSGYSGPPGSPVDLAVSPGASILAAPVSLTVATGAERYVLTAAVNCPPAGFADHPDLTILFYVNGANVNLTTFPAALGGSYSAVFRGSILGGVQSFDLFAYVSATTGTPTASGSLTVVMTN